MNTPTFTLGRILTDEELSAFHGGEGCTIQVYRTGNDTKVTTTGDCSNVSINVVVQA